MQEGSCLPPAPMGEYARQAVFSLLRDREHHGLEEIAGTHPRWRTGLRQLVAWGFRFDRQGNMLQLKPETAGNVPDEASQRVVDELIALDPDPDPEAPAKVFTAQTEASFERKKSGPPRNLAGLKRKKRHERGNPDVREGDGGPGGPVSEAPVEASPEEGADARQPEEVGQGREASLDVAHGLELGSAYVTETVAIIARKGSGKSYTAMVMAEELCKAGLPFVTLDPTGAWWGLGWGKDGSAARGMNIPIIGGEQGDMPVHPRNGAAVALWCVERYPTQLVVDLSLLTPEEQHLFAYGFFSTLFMKNRQAMHVFVDEADEFAAQTPKSPMEQKVLGQVDRVVRRGRIRGIGITLITQRSAVLNKNVLTQVGMLLALKTSGPQDLKAVEAWISRHLDSEEVEKILKALPGLPKGVLFHISGTGRKPTRHEVRKKTTFDSSKTPEVGEEVFVPPPRGRNVDELRAFIAEHTHAEEPDEEDDDVVRN